MRRGGKSGPDTGNPAVLTALVALYVAVLLLLASTGRYALMWKTAVVPLLFLAALLTGRGGRFVRDWAVFLALLVLFDCARGLVFALITRFELPVYMNYAIDLEVALGGGRIFPAILQDLVRDLSITHTLDRFLVMVHGSHFFVFLLLGLVVWFRRPGSFREYQRSVLLLLYVGVLLYLLVPTVPPWMAAGSFSVIPPIEHISAAIYNANIPTLQASFDVNPVAAMPSLHAALPTLCTLIAARHFGWRSWPMALYSLTVLVAIVYLGEHYLVDVLAGMALAAVPFLLVYGSDRLGRRRGGGSGIAGGGRLGRILRYRDGLGGSVLLAMSITLLGEGIGQITVDIRQPFDTPPEFVRRELKGRSELDVLFLGRYAFQHSELQSAVLHADAHLNRGNVAACLAIFEDLIDERPRDPEPLYWLTFYQYRAGLIGDRRVREVVGALEEYPGSKRVEMLQELLETML